MVRLKREQNAISPQDNFAKWAKIGRNYDKVEAQYNSKCMLRFLLYFGVTFAIHLQLQKGGGTVLTHLLLQQAT